jgi:hypothetical protein
MEEKEELNKLKGSYKQTNALLVVVGILLGSYTLNATEFNNLLTGIVAILVVLYGSYQYYRMDGKIGIILVAIGVLWSLGYVVMFFYKVY